MLGNRKTAPPALALLPGIIPKIRTSRYKMPDVFTWGRSQTTFTRFGFF